VTFSNIVIVHDLEDAGEDRSSQWMQHAVDRFRFRRRIDELAVILTPMLIEKINRYKVENTKV